MQHIPIRVVEELTGVPATTIRAWEKRYGCPAPTRSAGGHRLYSADDVDTVKRIRELTSNGLPASLAIEQLTQPMTAGQTSESQESDSPHSMARQRILSAVEQFDPEHIEMEVRRALMLGSAHSVYQHVLIPVMIKLSGRHGAERSLALAQSHLVSEVMRRAAQDLHRISRPGSPLATAVLACVTDESHTLPLYVIALGLHQRGIRTVVLGAQTSPDILKVTVDKIAPNFVALSSTITMSEACAQTAYAAYGVACQGRPWFVGGASADTHRSVILTNGGYVVDSEADLIRQIERKLSVR